MDNGEAAEYSAAHSNVLNFSALSIIQGPVQKMHDVEMRLGIEHTVEATDPFRQCYGKTVRRLCLGHDRQRP
jgi:hypothetical protein